MLGQIYGEVVKNLKSLKRQPVFVMMGLVPPLLLILVFIQAFGSTGDAFDLAVVNEDAPVQPGSWTDKFLMSLESREGTVPYLKNRYVNEAEAQRMFEWRETFAILWIPQGFNESLAENKPVTLRAKLDNIHEDVSKNVRLGLDARIYQFLKVYQLETGVRPGITMSPILLHNELSRPDYMMMGMLILTAVFLGLFYGGLFGAEEKDKGTFKEIVMARLGALGSKWGKVLTTMIVSALLLTVIILLNVLVFGPFFTTLASILTFYVVLVCLSFMFGLVGVNYGLKVGDFRAIPGPSIIGSLALWFLSGTINPLEFSAVPGFSKFLPTASAMRILVAVNFNRGLEYLNESILILGFWTILAVSLFAVFTVKDVVKDNRHYRA